jgi:hypothetical protein
MMNEKKGKKAPALKRGDELPNSSFQHLALEHSAFII